MRIAHLCRRLEISIDWLKQLERTGIVPPARRDLNGHRRYDEKDLERLRELLLERHQGRVSRAQSKKLPRRAFDTNKVEG